MPGSVSLQMPSFVSLSLLLHYLATWLLHMKTADSQQANIHADIIKPTINTSSEEHLPSMVDPHHRIFQQFLDSVSAAILVSLPLLAAPPCCSHLVTYYREQLHASY